MGRYVVTITDSNTYTVQVDADTVEDASDLAHEALLGGWIQSNDMAPFDQLFDTNFPGVEVSYHGGEVETNEVRKVSDG